MAPKHRSSRPKTYWIGQSKVDGKVLAGLVREGLISDVSKVRLPGKQEIPEPADDEAIVFVHYFRAGLRLPCDEMVIKVLKLFEVYLHQLTPNAIVRMGLFAWAARSEGVKASTRAFAAAHQLHHQPQPVFARGVQSEAHHGYLNFAYRAGLSTPAVVYKNKWPSDWTQWWFYHKVEAEEYLVSRCEEVRGNRVPDVRLKSSQQMALEAFARCMKYLSTCDLVEEFVAAGVWPLSRG